MLRYDLSIDLCEDYSRMVQLWMKRHGVVSDKTGWDLWYEFFNLQKKIIKSRKRKVNFSKEFFCPPEHQRGLDALLEKFRQGQNVTPHLSKAALMPSQFDGLLYDWGIYHFHLGTLIDPKSGYIQRTGPILFAKVDDTDVYCINVYSHGKGNQPWAKQEIIKILHNNWPETIERFKLPDGIKPYPDTLPLPTDVEYAALRKKGISTPIYVCDGVAYFSPGGGYMSSGHSAEIVTYCDRLWNTLKKNEIYIKEHINSFVAMIETTTGEPPAGKLYFKLWHEKDQLYVVDLRSLTALIKVEI